MVEIIFIVFFILLNLALLFQAKELNFLMEDGMVAAGFFPIILAGLLLILLISYLVRLLIKNKQSKDPYVKGVLFKQGLLVSSLILSMWLINYFGMLLTLGMFLLVLLIVVEQLSWKTSVVFSVSSIVCMFLIFDYWLEMSLPKGILW